jgi:hypothetical protein
MIKFDKKYNFLDVAKMAQMSPETGMMIGAGAGPFHVVGVNSELMPNLAYGVAAGGEGGGMETVRNRSFFAKVREDGGICCAKVPSGNTEGAFMANLFCSDGVVGPCLHITAKSRKGSLNFTETIQDGLKKTFGDRLISVGGVFLIKKGKVNLHVMPDFPESGRFEEDEKAVGKWLRFFDIKFDGQEPPLVCLSVFHSGKSDGLDLRMEHTHCFTKGGQDEDRAAETSKGGHYHYDLDDTKDKIEYEGWFNVAEYLYRVDQP